MAPIRRTKDSVNWNTQENDCTEGVTEWKLKAERHQQDVCDLVINYDWDAYKINEHDYLEKKIELIIFGSSENSPDKDKKRMIENVCKKVIEQGINNLPSEYGTCMAFVYIFSSQKGLDLQSWPVFKVPKSKDNFDAYFIDINARVYKDWDDFLKNNKFPPCEYCYPKGGKYNIDEKDKVILEFGYSPANCLSNTVVQLLDYTNAGLAIGTTIVTAASIFVPLSTPLFQACMWFTRGISAYSTVRSGATLYDRGMHKESVGLDNAESRSCWLAIGASTVGAASTSATNLTRKMAETGQVVGKLGCASTTALNISNVAFNGLGLLNSLHTLVGKYSQRELSQMDILQFSASVLLFAHAAVNVQTAKTIIENAQNSVLQDFENSLRSNRHRRMFRKVAKNTKGQQNTVEGNAQVIRALKHIDDVDDFFAALVRMDKQFRPTKSKVTFVDGGIQVNECFSVHPTELVTASKDERILLLDATKKYASNQIDASKFKAMAEAILGEIPSIPTGSPKKFPNVIELLWSGQANRKPMGSTPSPYPLLNAYERMDLIAVLKNFDEKEYEHILQVVNILFKALGFTAGFQFIEVANFVCGLIKFLANSDKIGRNTCGKDCCMSATDYCKAALQEFLQDPSKLMYLFNLGKSLIDALMQRNLMPTQYRAIGFFEFAQLSSLLLQVDKPFLSRLLEFSEEVAHTLGLTQIMNVIKIVKHIGLYINESMKELEQKHNHSTEEIPNAEKLWTQSCNKILNTISADKEIRESLIEEIWKSSDTFQQLSTSPKYTSQQPLEVSKSFWSGEDLSLLTQGEILDICQQALELENCPSNYNIEHEGLNVMVNVEDKLVVIKCFMDEGKISAFVESPATLQ